jgi:hypothetical protein
MQTFCHISLKATILFLESHHGGDAGRFSAPLPLSPWHFYPKFRISETLFVEFPTVESTISHTHRVIGSL